MSEQNTNPGRMVEIMPYINPRAMAADWERFQATIAEQAAGIERLRAALHEIATGSRANARRLAYAALGMTREADDVQS